MTIQSVTLTLIRSSHLSLDSVRTYKQSAIFFLCVSNGGEMRGVFILERTIEVLHNADLIYVTSQKTVTE
jgi:hypothetical protein